jgi:hypothetical protein
LASQAKTPPRKISDFCEKFGGVTIFRFFQNWEFLLVGLSPEKFSVVFCTDFQVSKNADI